MTNDETTEEKEIHQETTKETNPVAVAEEILSKITEQNKIMGENIARQEELVARNMLSGKGLAGQEPVIKTANDLANEKAREMLIGTGYEDMVLN